MITNSKKFNAFKNVRTALRTASKTVRNFTSENDQDTLPACVSVCLDWFHYSANCGWPEPVDGQDVYWVTDTMALEYLGHGTPVYKHSYMVILEGEPVATLHTHGKNKKIIKEGGVKIELMNHLLYTTEWLNIYDTINDGLKVVPTTTGRIDIAIDGLNHIPTFMQCYQKQDQKNKSVMLKGRAFVDCKRQNSKSMLFQNFKIGSKHKCITIYNKTQEIDKKSNKQYIKRVWETQGLDMTTDNWRCELRMDSQGIKAIEGMDIRRLTDPYYLLQIFRTQIKNFFEFVIVEGDKNVSRCKEIDLFNFDKLKVTLLNKVVRTVQRGAYKAKMAIHNAVANIMLTHINGEDINHAFKHRATNLKLYDLWEFYKKKVPDWVQLYQPVRPMYGYQQPAGSSAPQQVLLDMNFWDKCKMGL